MQVAYHFSYSFADEISPEIVRRVAGVSSVDAVNLWRPPSPASRGIVPKVATGMRLLRDSVLGPPQRSPCLLSLGSIFQHAAPSDVIWGTGINPRWQPRRRLPFPVDVRAVRGPLTRRYMIEELGLNCPEVYGDPALLIPRLFPEFQIPSNPGHDYSVFLQHNDEEYIAANRDRFPDENIVCCQRINRLSWQDAIRRILDSKFVISSSLHGLIIAEAFGIPARWWHSPDLPSSYTEHSMKFNDYYMSTGRAPNQFSGSIEQALADGPTEGISNFDADRLMDAFPHERFSK